MNFDFLQIVTTSYHGPDRLQNLIQSLKSQDFKNWSLCVVDHGPHELPKFQDSQIEVLRASSDLWFTAAINHGLRYVFEKNKETSPYALMICNDDIQWGDSSSVSIALGQLREKQLLAFSAKDPSGELLYSGVHFKPLRFCYEWQRTSSVDPIVECDVLPSRCLLCLDSAVNELGILNEKEFPHYGSDLEWTALARNQGYELEMLNSKFVISERNEKARGPGAGRYDSPKFRGFWAALWDEKQNESIVMIARFATNCFSFPYAQFYIGAHFVRKVFGFFLNNFIRA